VRLARSGAPVRQIVTGTICHLEADVVRKSLDGWNLNELEFLFIENVGNLVCPAAYDLGEDLRVVMMSVTEGEDKPLKYPPIFYGADLLIINKTALAEAVEFDMKAAARNIDAVHPRLPLIYLSARNGTGMQEWLRELFCLAGIDGMLKAQNDLPVQAE
jgi:hydrogenase nickel incorporation protein HypB